MSEQEKIQAYGPEGNVLDVLQARIKAQLGEDDNLPETLGQLRDAAQMAIENTIPARNVIYLGGMLCDLMAAAAVLGLDGKAVLDSAFRHMNVMDVIFSVDKALARGRE